MTAPMRQLARLCLILMLWPQIAASATVAVPVVTNITGAVALQGASGARRDVLSSQIVHSGDVLLTGMNSLAIVGLADVGRVRLGPATTATTFSTGSDLSLRLHAGLLCVQSDTAGVRIDAGPLSVASSRTSTIFNMQRNASGTSIAIYQGQVSASMAGKPPSLFDAGSAVQISGGNVTRLPITSTRRQFAPLRCPDQSVIAQAEAIRSKIPSAVAVATQAPTTSDNTQSTTAAPPSSSGGGGGGILGVLLGLAGLAAIAAGHGGGGGGSNPAPSSQPSVSPSPSPSPGPFSVDPGTLVFNDVGSSAVQPFRLSESNFGGSFGVDASGCAGVAAVSGPPYTGPSSSITVTPQNSGTCSINVNDGHGGSSSVSITVGPFGSLSPSTSSFSFIGTGNTTPLQVTESNYAGQIVAASSDQNVASVTPGSAAGPTAAFTVQSQGVGNANILVSDDHGGQQAVLASVVIGSITVSTATMQFSGPADPAADFTAFDIPPVNFTATSSDLGVAVVNFDSFNPRRTTFSVTPVGTGKAAILILDSDGSQAVVNVGVGVSPLLIKRHPLAPPAVVRIPRAPSPRPGVTPAPKVGVVQSGPSVAKPLSRPLNIEAPSREPLVLSVNFLTLAAGTSPQQVTASERNYAGSFSAITSSALVVTVDAQAAPGGLGTFRITPHSAGAAFIRIADDHGNMQVIRVIVMPPVQTARPQSPQRPSNSLNP